MEVLVQSIVFILKLCFSTQKRTVAIIGVILKDCLFPYFAVLFWHIIEDFFFLIEKRFNWGKFNFKVKFPKFNFSYRIIRILECFFLTVLVFFGNIFHNIFTSVACNFKGRIPKGDWFQRKRWIINPIRSFITTHI